MDQTFYTPKPTPQQQWSEQLSNMRQAYELGELQKGGAQRAAERRLGESQSLLGMYGMGLDPRRRRTDFGALQREGERAYSFGREKEELERLNMAAQAQKLQSQMRFMPQMDAVRAGILSRMGGGSVGMGAPYSSGTGYTPSWDKPRPSWAASPSQYIAPSWTSQTTPKFPLSA